MTVLLREAIGGSLRRARTDRRRTLREVSNQARVSLGYLSEVERGRKEASSELLAAICDALEFPLPDLLAEVADAMRPAETVSAMPPMQPMPPLVPVGARHGDLARHGDIRRAVTTGGVTVAGVGGPGEASGPASGPATALVRAA